MKAQLDHLVYATPDLAATTQTIGVQLGVIPATGGSHVGRGTANTLLSLGDGTYLEIVGPDPAQADPEQPRPFGVDLLAAPRLVTFALRVASMDAAIAGARAGGYDPGDATPMQRATPDGGLLSWTLTQPTAWSGGVVPFLVDWLASPHPSTTIGATANLRELTVATDQDDRVTQAFSALGLAMVVQRAHEPLLTAVIEGPAGSMTLSSDPWPSRSAGPSGSGSPVGSGRS